MLALLQVLAFAPEPGPIPPVLPAEAAIVWRAPQGCPTQREVEARVAELAGRVPLLGELEARAEVRRGEQWSMRLTIRSDATRHEQSLVADECQALANAAALIVAVLLDPVATAAVASEAVLAEGVPAGPTRVTTAVPAEPPAPRWRLGLDIGVGGEFAAVPRGTAGAQVHFFARRGLLELRVGGSYWVPRRSIGGSAPGARVQLGAGAVGACVVPAAGRLRFPLCATIDAGAVRALGVGVANPRPVTLGWLAATVTPGVRWWVRPRFALFASAALVAPIFRPRLTLGSTEDGTVLHDTVPAGFRAVGGIAVGFSPIRDGS